MSPQLTEKLEAPHFSFIFVCFDKHGKLKWHEVVRNLVVTVGRNNLLDTYFSGAGYTAGWFLGLKGAGAAALGDTLSSHTGWSEVNPYTGNRPSLAWSPASGASKSATTIVYTITAVGPTTVAGGFLTNQLSGTSGLLYSAGDFTAARAVSAGDILNVTPTVNC